VNITETAPRVKGSGSDQAPPIRIMIGGVSSAWSPGRYWRVPAAILVLAMTAGCGDDDATGVAASGPTSSANPAALETGSSTSVPGQEAAPESTVAPPGPQSDSTATTSATVPEPPVGSPGLPPEPPPAGPVTLGGGQAATGLVADPRCDPAALARPLVTFTWNPSGSGEQRLVVSTRQDGFESGIFTSSEPLEADRTSYQLSDSQSGGVYYWRVLTRAGDAWAASETAQFDGPTCAPF